MDDPGFADSGGDERATGGLTRRLVLSARAALVVAGMALLTIAVAGDRFVLTEWLGHLHPLFWMPILVLVPLSWIDRWLSVSLFVLLTCLLAFKLHQEQPNLLWPGKPVIDARQQDAIRLSFWNVMSFNRGEDVILEGFQNDDPDIVCLVEGTYQGAVHDSLSRGLGREYTWVSVRQMAIGSRLPILRSRELPTRSRLRVFEVRVLTPDGPLGVVVADLPSPPRIDTRPMLQELGALLQTIDAPYVLVGDLNTSRASWRLQRATRELADFYTVACPDRWLASFPDYFPLWQIDHAFAGPGVEPLFANFGERGSSNHLRVSIGFALKDSAPAGNDQAFAPGAP